MKSSKNNVLVARSDYELERFDLVQQLNNLDSQKKIKLSEVCCDFSSLLYQMQTSMYMHDDNMQKRINNLPLANQIVSRNERLWDGMRSRLEAEIAGCLPPPGAPFGAFSPDERLLDVPADSCLFSASLTTEVRTVIVRGLICCMFGGLLLYTVVV